jgi:hypothetical protein
MRHCSISEVSSRSIASNLREGILHSIGKIDYTPSTNWNGEKLVEVLTEVRVCPKCLIKHDMSVIFSLADIFLQNGLERLVHGLCLSFFLGVVRGRMTMLKP